MCRIRSCGIAYVETAVAVSLGSKLFHHIPANGGPDQPLINYLPKEKELEAKLKDFLEPSAESAVAV